MKRIKVNSDTEQLLVTGMCISERICRTFATKFNRSIFKSSYLARIAAWAVRFYKQHYTAPGEHIQDIFNEWASSPHTDPDDVDAIANILSQLSYEHERREKFNEEYVLTEGQKYFNLRILENISDEIATIIENNGDVTEAESLLQEYEETKINLSMSNKCDPLIDKDKIKAAFETNAKPLFLVPGKLGDILNSDLSRGSFVAFLGSEKRGKSQLLQELAIRAALQRCNVDYFQCGDMSEEQQIKRIHIRISGRPAKSKYCGKQLIPVMDCWHNQTDSCDEKYRTCMVGCGFDTEDDFKSAFKSHDEKKRIFKIATDDGYQPCTYCYRTHPDKFKASIWYKEENIEQLTWRDAVKAGVEFDKKMHGRHFQLITYPTDTLNTDMIQAHIEENISNRKSPPDVVVVDYPDIMSPSPHQAKDEFRHKQNGIWKGLRKISIKYNCLVLVVTQANAAAYGQDSLDLSNFSEDKRKYAHVTSMYSMNQTAWEKVAGIIRIGILVMREDDYDLRQQVCVMQNLPTGRAIMGSFPQIF